MYWEWGKKVLCGERREKRLSVLCQYSILQMLSSMFFTMCGIIIHPHLNRLSQILHSAMPAAPEDGCYSDCRWMKSDRITSKLSFISKGRV